MSAGLLVTALLQLASDAGDAPSGEMHITARRPGADSVAVDDVVAGPAALLAVPGVGLARDGGPLAPTRPLVRGLGGARLAVDVAGLGFSDPTSGEIDVALLPLALGTAVVDPGGGASSGLGGGLSVRPAPGSRFQLVVGELSTLQGSVRLQTPVEGGHVTTAIAGGTTRGDFPFSVTDADGAGAASLVRGNNDRRRLNAGVVVNVGGPAPGERGHLGVRVVAAGALHEGGIPGFATAPLSSLRGEQARGVVGGALTWREGARHIGVAADALGDRRRTRDDADLDEVATVASGVGVVLGDVLWADDAVHVVGDVDARGGAAVVADIARRSEARAGARVVATTGVAGLVVAARGDASLAIVADTDLEARAGGPVTGPIALPNASLMLSLAPPDRRVTASLSARHRARAPTLDERFAPAGFVRGTPDLRPERLSELEGRLGLQLPGRTALAVDVATFASRLDDAIVFVNKNAFEVAPANTGLAHRAGVELGLGVRLHPLIVVTQAATLLWSVVEATGAPLPTAPPLGLRSDVRVGTDDAFVGATVTGRGSAPSTIFGTLGSGAFVLVDLRARLPLAERLAATFHVDNALDVRTARDQNLLPLPGRLAFVGLEVRP